MRLLKTTEDAGSLLRQRVVQLARRRGITTRRSISRPTTVTRTPIARSEITKNIPPPFDSKRETPRKKHRSSGKEL